MGVKREKFIRLAEARTEKAIAMIDLIGNLSNRSFYEYSQDDVEKIFKALTFALENSKNKFKIQKKSSKRRFTL